MYKRQGQKRPEYEGHLLSRDLHLSDFEIPADSLWAGYTLRELKEAEEKEAAKAKEAEKEVKEEESHNTGSNTKTNEDRRKIEVT